MAEVKLKDPCMCKIIKKADEILRAELGSVVKEKIQEAYPEFWKDLCEFLESIVAEESTPPLPTCKECEVKKRKQEQEEARAPEPLKQEQEEQEEEDSSCYDGEIPCSQIRMKTKKVKQQQQMITDG
jgi:hypothetical protein